MKFVVPFAALLGSIAIYFLLVSSKPQPKAAEIEPFAPLVRVIDVSFEDLPLEVTSQGTVSAPAEIDLVPEVAGRVVFVSPSLADGGFFEKDEPLLRIDPRDFELAMTRSRADIARARLHLAREEAEAKVARDEWEDLGKGEATPLSLREPQLAEARAELDSATAALERAKLDLARTTLAAPFAGRVRSKSVDIGQYVSRGAPVARLYSIDYAEVRLPVPDAELAFLDLPLDLRGRSPPPGARPEVTLTARFRGELHSWKGRIVRTEGEIDPRSRMVRLVARVENPYGGGPGSGEASMAPPLAVGMFVRATIQGRIARNIADLPRTALRDANRVFVVDEESRLRYRPVSILRREIDRVLVSSGLEAGERICVSPLEAVVDGMRVRVDEPGGDA